MSTTTKDYYKVLGVSENADAGEIRKAYRKLAKRFHPDANQGDPKAAERFKEIGEAHQVLSNSEKRKQYDRMRKMGSFGFRGADRGGPGGPGRTGGPQPGGSAGGFSFEDLSDLGGLGDLFSSIFDRGRRETGRADPRTGPRRGQDVEYVVEIAFLTAVRGGKISVSVPITEECATCGGTGAQPGTPVNRCKECRGSGTVSFGQGGFSVNRPCPACMGRGSVPESPCVSCRGSGSVRQGRKIQVTVPQAVDTGSKLRLSGQGERGMGGGEPGDVILTFKVKPHRFFRRDGLDIHVSVPINVAQAMLGTKLRVRTVHGRHVVLRVPPGTQSGTRFRIPGQGIARAGRTGDQYVEVKVEIPDSLTEEGKERVRALADEAGLRH
jgi:molecular chaperone DnaJ